MQLKQNSFLQGGKYRIEKVLGQGGFGITYLAYDNHVNKYVAIKEFFLKQFCGREETSQRVITQMDHATIERFKTKFIKEAKTLMSFNYPNIVRVFDCFEENNTAYYVMDYVEGSSMADVIRQNGRLDESKALFYIRKVASALQYLHSRNINHLDIKPGNILLRKGDSEIILIDFGTAKHYDVATGEATTLTQAGYSQGYAAIEQYRQGGVSSFSPETDIYSLGATLFKMLTGQTPPEPSVIVENGLPTLPSWISEGTKSAIYAAMQVSKSSRPHSISEFLGILDGDEATCITNEDTISATNVVSTKDSATLVPKPTPATSNKKSGSSIGWIVAIIIAIIGGVIWFVSNQNNPPLVSDNVPEVPEEPAETMSIPTDVQTIVNMFLKNMHDDGCCGYDLYSEMNDIQEYESVTLGNSGYNSIYKVKLTSNGEYINKQGSSRLWTMTLSGPHYGANMLRIESGEINDMYKDNMKSAVAKSLGGRNVKSYTNDMYMEYSLYETENGYYAIIFDWGASAMWMSIYASSDRSVIDSVIAEKM